MDTHRQFLTIQELSRNLDIPKPTLRFWESEFKGILVPARSRGGQRRYTSENIIIIKKIKFLKHQGHSLTEIKDILLNDQNQKELSSYHVGIDFLAERIAEAVKTEIYNFFQNEDLANKSR